MTTQAELIDSLRDIYAMDKAMETALNKLTDHPRHYPALRRQAAMHCTETRRHAEAMARFLKQLGSDTSSLKNVLAQGLGTDMMRSTGTAFARDERIRDVLTVLVTEHFEIACHSILRTRAAQLGLQEIVRTCDEVLCEDKSMVCWLQLHMPQIFSAYLAQEEDADADGCAPARSEDSQGWAPWELAEAGQKAAWFGGLPPWTRPAHLQN